MPGKWKPAPNAGTWQVALQSQLGVKGCVREATPLSDLWKNLGRSNGVWADWAARFADYGTSRSAEDKDRLPAINVSTICGSTRRTSDVVSHTGLIVIDIDHAHNAPVLAGEIRRCEHVMGDFVSPSGNGVKAIIPVNPIPSSAGDHRSAYSAVKDAIEDYIANCTTKYQYEIDESGKDPVRLMFAYSHTPSRVGLSREAVPVQWKPKEIPPALASVSTDPVELDEFLAVMRVLKLRAHIDWLRARGAAITQGLTFDEWDAIASQHGGYEGRAKQLRQWDHDVQHGNRIPAKTVFLMAKEQNKKPSDWRKHMVNPKPYTSISEGSQAATRANAPATGDKPSKPKETGSTGHGDKASTFQCAEAFMGYCDESGDPYCYWPDRGWMRYSDHGWELDNKAADIRKRLGYWAQGPQGLAMQAPTSNYGRKGVLDDATVLRYQAKWDDTQNIGLPNRGVLVMNDDGLAEKEQGNWRHYISKRTGGLVGSMDREMSDLWTTCVEQWMEDDDVRFYVQVLLGAALLGRAVSTRSVLYIQSASQYGKSTFLDAILGAFGDYGLNAPPETFMKKFSNEHPAEIARMQGRRLVIASELPRNGFWNAARIKQLSGGEKVAARFMRQDWFEFRPEFLIVLSGNHDPNLMSGESEGLKQRLKLVRWSKRGFVNPDRNLSEKLASESGRATVLQWLVNGAEHFAQDGLPEVPEIMRMDSDVYFDTADLVSAFKKTFDFGDDLWSSSSTLRDHYNEWARTEEIPKDRRFDKRRLKREFLNWGCREKRKRLPGKANASRGMAGLRPKGDDLTALDYS